MVNPALFGKSDIKSKLSHCFQLHSQLLQIDQNFLKPGQILDTVQSINGSLQNAFLETVNDKIVGTFVNGLESRLRL